jgi:hypothetical protein
MNKFYCNVWAPVIMAVAMCGCSPEKSGKLSPPSPALVKPIIAEVAGPPRERVQCTLAPGETDFAAGPKPQTYTLTLANQSATPLENVTVEAGVTDAVTGKSILQISRKLTLPGGGKQQRMAFTPEMRFGQFVNIEWKVSDAAGPIPQASGRAAQCTRLFQDASPNPDQPAEGRYLYRWSPNGGVLWGLPYQRAVETGATWMREVELFWSKCEPKPGKYDFTPYLETLAEKEKCSMEVVFDNYLYGNPTFYRPESLEFALKYGWFNRQLAKAAGNRLRQYELSNETNGVEKYAYTEQARHGAAGIRSANAAARIANAGTAGVDFGFLRMQANRGLFEYLDEVVTHPYASEGPEVFGLWEQYGAVDKWIDELGGMKSHYTTEWGYHHTNVNQDDRAKWIVRHFAIATAAGLARVGLFAWDNHFGIHDNGRPYPAAAAVNAYCVLTRGAQFAGWLRRDDSAWAAVFERGGVPLLMAWSPKDQPATLALDCPAAGVVVRDIYGNPLPASGGNGRLSLAVDGHPVYVQGIPLSILQAVRRNAATEATVRYQRVLDGSSLKNRQPWAALAKQDSPSAEALRNALMSWQGGPVTISYADQAVIAQTLRRAILAARTPPAGAAATGKPTKPATGGATWDKWQTLLRQSVAQDVDIPSLRWIIAVWQRTHDEAAMHREDRNTNYAAGLEALDEVFDHLCRVFAQTGHRVFFPIWPYLHATPADSDTGIERFVFTPGKPTPVKVRLKSYAATPYEVRVHLDLPTGWQCQPASWKGPIKPGQQIDTEFQVTPSLTKASQFFAVLSVKDKPLVTIPYDNFEIQLPLDIRAGVSGAILPGAPLPLTLINRQSKAISGKLRILPGVDLPPLAVAAVENLQPGESRTLNLQFPNTLVPPTFNEWNLVVNMTVGDDEVTQPLTVDFDCAVKAAKPPKIDGELSEWIAAAPLHLDQEAYSDGSFGGNWSKDDLSAVVYTMWDSSHFYFAAKVRDQTFQQELSGLGVWKQDSIQIALSEDEKKMKEFSLALPPKGPQVWYMDDDFSDNNAGKKVGTASLAVKLLPGMAIYECAIPWVEIFGHVPAETTPLRFDVLINDDDVVAPRRYMFRYGRGIVYTKKAADLGYLRLIGQNANAPAALDDQAGQNKNVFYEDFEEYKDDALPDMWRTVSMYGPVPQSVVRGGVGRNGSKALVLNNTVGSKPGVFLNLVRIPGNLQPGEKYELSAWVKGSGVTNIGIASDLAGVQGFQYTTPWKPSDEWQKVSTELSIPASGGRLYLVIRNETVMTNLIIDDLRITKQSVK